MSVLKERSKIEYIRKQIKIPMVIASSIELPLISGDVQINDFLKYNKILCDYLKEKNINFLPYMSATYNTKTHILSYVERVIK